MGRSIVVNVIERQKGQTVFIATCTEAATIRTQRVYFGLMAVALVIHLVTAAGHRIVSPFLLSVPMCLSR
jgi:hypothetical protein